MALLSLRHYSLWWSFVHATTVLVCIPVAIGMQCYSLFQHSLVNHGESEPGKLLARMRLELIPLPPTPLEAFISAFAGFYYTQDLILMWLNVHPLSLLAKGWYTLHHVFCFIGLTAPVYWHSNSFDCILALAGFFLGEISNPPRCIVDLIQAQIDEQGAAQRARAAATPTSEGVVTVQTGVWLCGRKYGVRYLRQLMAAMLQVHLVLFIMFRFVGTYFFAYVIWPYATLGETLWMGGLTLVLSLIAVGVMLQGGVAPVDNDQDPDMKQATKPNGSKKAE